jgi:hypothetical protein
MKAEEIITNEQLDLAWGNADFGSRSKRDILKFALLKATCGYANGHTAECIIKELGLVGKSQMKGNTLTKKGKEYLWQAFGEYGF